MTLAVTQPVLGTMGDSPEHFVVAGASVPAIVCFALVVAVLPAAALALIGLGLGAVDRRLGELWQPLAVGAGIALFVLLIGRDAGLGRLVASLVATLVWFAAVYLYREHEATRMWPMLLAAFAPVVVALFLFASPTSSLVISSARAENAEIEANGAPVVMLVFDEFPLETLLARGGMIDAELYPNISRLADDGTWYRNTTTVHGLTQQAVPSILTGTYPQGEKTAPTAAHYPRSLFSLLASDYRLDVTEHFEICGSNACTGRSDASIGSALRELLGDAAVLLRYEAFPESESGLPVHGWDASVGVDDVAAFEAMLDRMSERDRSNALYFQHMLLPHGRFQFLPDGTRYNDPDPWFGLSQGDRYVDHAWSGEETASLARVRQRLQTMWVDTLVGRLLDRLEALDIYDETLIVLTADHGISLTAGQPHRSIVSSNAAEIVWVPLIVKQPGQAEGRITDANVQLVDVLPTVARALDIDLDWDVDGVVAGDRTDRTKHFFGEWDGDDPDEGREFHSTPDLEQLLRGTHAPSTNVAAPFRPYTTGVGDELLGRSVGELDGTPVEVGYRFWTPEAWSDVDTGAARVNALVAGELDVESPGDVLAVAVNGHVAAVTRTFEYEGVVSRFAAMIPPALLDDGDNDIVLYLVDEDARRPLQRIGAAG